MNSSKREFCLLADLVLEYMNIRADNAVISYLQSRGSEDGLSLSKAYGPTE